MLILSRACAEFRNRLGETVLSITPRDLLTFVEAPEEIQEDPLFTLMLRDGSLEAVRSVDQRRMLESDPDSGTSPEGRKQKTHSQKDAYDGTPTSDIPASTGPASTAPAEAYAHAGAAISEAAALTEAAAAPAGTSTPADAPAEAPASGAVPAAKRTRKTEK